MSSLEFPILLVCTATVLVALVWARRRFAAHAERSPTEYWPAIQIEALSLIWRAEKHRAECVTEFMTDYDFMRRNPRFIETAAELRSLAETKLSELDEETADGLVALENRAAACGASAQWAAFVSSMCVNNQALQRALAVRVQHRPT